MDVIAQLNALLAGRYTLSREIGAGGMATVYLAHDEKHDRPIALKVLNAEFAGNVNTERFLREIRVAARLTHPHILALHDSGVAGDRTWYVMPFVDGESLRDLLTRERQLSLDHALRLAEEVARALAHAHAHGIVHRDIKPENILLADGHALVADFGIAQALNSGDARLTATGVSVGTPAYMSPEQASGERVIDGRSDVYSLGCVLYEMLAGQPPFTGATAQAIVARHLTDPVPPLRTVRPGVPEAIDAIVRRALAKVPADRYPNAPSFVDALSAARAETGAGGVSAAKRIGRPATIRRAGRIVGGVLVLGVLVAVRQLTRPLTAETGHSGTPQATGLTPGAMRDSASAYDAYLRGNYLLSHPLPGGNQLKTAEDSAIAQYERAIAHDPSFALAWSALANVYQSRFFNRDADRQWEEKAFVAIEKALALDPGLAEAYQMKANLSWTLSNGFPHETVALLHRKAISLRPGYAAPHFSLGSLYMHTGLLDQALAQYDTARRLDPANRTSAPRIARIHWFQGKYAIADAEFARLPGWERERSIVLNYLGRKEEALALLSLPPADTTRSLRADIAAARAVIMASMGRRPDAEHEIATARALGDGISHFHHAAYMIAQAYALLGDSDRAVEWLRRTATDGMPCYPLFRDDPNLTLIWGNPAFVRFLEEQRKQWEGFKFSL